jgi:uncharacterized membrane protein
MRGMERSGPPRHQVVIAVCLLGAVFLVVALAGALWLTRYIRQDEPRGIKPRPTPQETFTVAQEEQDTYFPVKFFPYTGDCQAVAQTFSPPRGGMFLTDLSLFIHYSIGDVAFLDLYEVEGRRHPEAGDRLASERINLFSAPRTDWTTVRFERPVRMKAARRYAFVIRVRRLGTEVGVGRISFQDLYPKGEAWYYTRPVGGNGEILANRHVWQYEHDDLAFRLDFARSPSVDD